MEIPGIQTAFVTVKGSKLYCEVAGKGHPLVLIHGSLLDRRMWDTQFEVLARSYLVIRYDIRGYGQSQMGTAGYSDVQDLRTLLEKLGIQRAYLLGLSLGTSIAIDFALAYPKMVDALILAAPSIQGYDNLTPETELREEILEDISADGDRERLYDFWVSDPMMPDPEESPQAYQRYREILSDYSFAHYLKPAPKLKPKKDAFERIAEIRKPTLILVGDKDALEIEAQADLLEAAILDSQKVTFPGARHMLNLERPEHFNRVIITFLRKLEEGL